MDYEYLLNRILSTLGVIGSVVFVVFFFGMCIFVHELGHFLAARLRGLHVDAFSIGFKKIWGKKINGVEYRIGCLPLGGYVELPQVDSATDTPHAADGTELPRAKPLDRIITAAAGPVFNILFGFVLGCVVWWWGIPQDTPKMREIEVAVIEENSPEFRAGLRRGDRIVKLNGKEFKLAWKDFVAEILTTIGDVHLEVRRGGETLEIVYKPEVNPHVMQVEKTAIPFFLPVVPLELHPDRNSPAEKAGIKAGDQLLAINGRRDFNDFAAVQFYINYYGDKPLKFEMRRPDGEIYTTEVLADKQPDELNFLTLYYAGVVIEPNLRIQAVFPDYPAERAGVLPGDTLLAYNGKPIHTVAEFTDMIQAGQEREFTLTVRRDGKEREIKLAAKAVPPRTIGVDFMLRDHPTPLQQFTALLELTAKSMRSIGVRIGNQLGLTESQSNLSVRNMSGPVGMAMVLYRSVRLSPALGLYFVVMISFALAIFNLLPIPVLDGGHVFMALLEIIFRRPLPAVVVKAVSFAFVGLLILMMVYVTWIDILRAMPQDKGSPVGNGGVQPSAAAPAQTSAPAPEKAHE